MTCKNCDDAIANPKGYYPYRIGNQELGWGNIVILGCREHVKLALDKLNDEDKQTRVYHSVKND